MMVWNLIILFANTMFRQSFFIWHFNIFETTVLYVRFFIEQNKYQIWIFDLSIFILWIQWNLTCPTAAQRCAVGARNVRNLLSNCVASNLEQSYSDWRPSTAPWPNYLRALEERQPDGRKDGRKQIRNATFTGSGDQPRDIYCNIRHCDGFYFIILCTTFHPMDRLYFILIILIEYSLTGRMDTAVIVLSSEWRYYENDCYFLIDLSWGRTNT